ncbi:hypothetical protein [Qipengyuania marisflavi]|uniref:Uncharacterized protein n=1 Tax=Qipengyuania marisflavi TaxID=2486356 RepID=A0A5S3P8V7_9SPHN|nr:hypothetical protein [Qipengyuania marisflavi]TMM49881.1 hypothetical protein FEV51_01390 [Qipengyuania marisflavi]
MSYHPQDFWLSQENDAAFSTAGICEKRNSRFERTVRRRNLLEFAAGLVVILTMGSAAIAAMIASDFLMAGAQASLVFGVVAVLWKLRCDGSNLVRTPEMPCRDYFRHQLVRQRDLLRTVPKWYLAPMIPGVLAIYGLVTAQVASRHGWATALDGVWLPLGGTALFFGFVAWLNAKTAQGLDQQIAALDAAE